MNNDEKEIRFKAILQIGCLCCWLNLQTANFLQTNLPVQIHHLNAGGLHGNERRGHEFTIGLCWWHHMGSFNGLPAPSGYRGLIWMQLKADIHGPSWAQGSKTFHAFYPSDAELLKIQNELVEELQA